LPRTAFRKSESASDRAALSRQSIEHALRAKTRRASYRCAGILPLCDSFGSEDSQCGSGDEVALKVEGVVNRTVHA
jgi:hypothetical protein